MPKFWQSIKGAAPLRREEIAHSRYDYMDHQSSASMLMEPRPSKSYDDSVSSLGPALELQGANRTTEFLCQEGIPSPLYSHADEDLSVREGILAHSAPPVSPGLFRPGWSFRSASHDSGLQSETSAGEGMLSERTTCTAHQKPDEAKLLLDRGRSERIDQSRNTRDVCPQAYEAPIPARSLRTMTSSPSMSSRTGSKASPLPPPNLSALRARNASYGHENVSSARFDSLPRPLADKPLPPVPTIRQRSNPELYTTKSPKQRLERAKPPSSYIQAQAPISCGLDGEKRDALSPRSRMVVEVLGHMVVLLKAQDVDSLMEFSSLVASQARAMRMETQQSI